ncbi:MAG: hypothetical protein IJ341_11430 [Bacteroidales bacterium]|nr:hypothetical protein [Bacteroidales bacterium]
MEEKKVINETKIIIKERFEGEYHTISIEENGTQYFTQTRHNSCHKGTQTFLDEFISRLSSGYDSPQDTIYNPSYIIPDSGDLFYLISKSRLKTLNLKQKFFHFLLKHIFLNGKAATIENIKALCVNDNSNNGKVKNNLKSWYLHNFVVSLLRECKDIGDNGSKLINPPQ